MGLEKYIKVTMPGEQPRVILATLRTFYVSQGAKIEKPTAAEVADAFPGEVEQVAQPPVRSCDERLKAEIEKWKTNATKQAESIKVLKKEKAELEAKVADMNEQVTSLEAALSETEALVSTLKAEKENGSADEESGAEQAKTEHKPNRYGSKK